MALAPLLDVDDLSRILGLAPRTIYKPDWQKRARLHPIRIGRTLRFHFDDVQRLVMRGRPFAAIVDNIELREWARRHGLQWPEGGKTESET